MLSSGTSVVCCSTSFSRSSHFTSCYNCFSSHRIFIPFSPSSFTFLSKLFTCTLTSFSSAASDAFASQILLSSSYKLTDNTLHSSRWSFEVCPTVPTPPPSVAMRVSGDISFSYDGNRLRTITTCSSRSRHDVTFPLTLVNSNPLRCTTALFFSPVLFS